ncbi:hypothetical protein PHET_11835 [Paragonimus heterotremus]|uniref:Nucleoside diphosphate kinase-like domain-containing protein n=1 Tax=Paragonimus heterotremus TaxID=100268 RepID=A0A8J4SSV7_9TREM|nr:hypothetical protein PHET_11835 [Paragonimus heterotremus]
MNIRAVYGKNVLENAVHGSTTAQHALKTIKLIFGDEDIGLPEKTDVCLTGCTPPPYCLPSSGHPSS